MLGRWNSSCSSLSFRRPSDFASSVLYNGVHNNRRRCQLFIVKGYIQILKEKEVSNANVTLESNIVLFRKRIFKRMRLHVHKLIEQKHIILFCILYVLYCIKFNNIISPYFLNLLYESIEARRTA